MKQTIKEAGYKYDMYLGSKEHRLLNLNTGKHEVFVANKNHASWGIIYKNTHLEFVATMPF